MGRHKKYATEDERRVAIQQRKNKYMREVYAERLKEKRRKEKQEKIALYELYKEGKLYDANGNQIFIQLLKA